MDQVVCSFGARIHPIHSCRSDSTGLATAVRTARKAVVSTATVDHHSPGAKVIVLPRKDAAQISQILGFVEENCKDRRK
ncbi:MAG: hypothetical protein JSV96_12370 [Candidatus Aminicenantes bacterium]|nr:MAG: hypothetical protein JSV96_12370 [Candidatus Aminicenantes bacterium]